MSSTETVQFAKTSSEPAGWMEIADGQDFVNFRAIAGANAIFIGDEEPSSPDLNMPLNEGTLYKIKNANSKVWLYLNPNKVVTVIRGDAEIL